MFAAIISLLSIFPIPAFTTRIPSCFNNTNNASKLPRESAFAIIPAQNATGNWIKVVQRLPVRIELDPEELKLHPLQVGLSMQVDIDVSDYKK